MQLTSDLCLEWEKSTPVPYGFDEACNRSLKTHFLYKKPGDRILYCSHCGYENEIEWAKHGDVERCQKCGVEAKIWRTQSNTNFGNHGYSSVVKMLRKDGNVFIHTVHQVRLEIKDLMEVVDVNLIEVSVLHEKDLNNYKHGYEWDNGGWKLRWIPGRINLNSPFDSSGGYYPKSMDPYIETVYPVSMVEFLQDTDLRYTCIGEAVDMGLKFNIKYLQIARVRPYYEFLWKTGQRTLYEALFTTDQGHRDVKYMMKHYRKQMVESRPDPMKVPFIRYLIANGMTPSVKMFKIASHTYGEIVENYKPVAQFTTLDKFIKWMSIKEYSDYLYKDYINLMVKIGTPVNKKTAFPDDIKKAHDDATKKFNAIKLELESKSYEAIYQELKKLEFMDNDLRIIVPKNLNEILQEGKDQNHCVGSYVDRVAQGKTAILFIRHATSPLEAYYTMEYQGGKIVQIRGKHNKDATKEVAEFTQAWLEWTKNPKKKPKKQKQPVMQLQAVNA